MEKKFQYTVNVDLTGEIDFSQESVDNIDDGLLRKFLKHIIEKQLNCKAFIKKWSLVCSEE